ncbi:MAG TPA: diguanylate cyclase [Cellvibrionaceae bacterium]
MNQESLYSYKLHLALLLAFVIALTAVIIERASHIPERQAHQGRVVNKMQNAVTYLTALTADVADAETGQRGYLLTGDERYLQPYNVALEQISANEQILRELFSADTHQQQQLSALSDRIANKLAELKQTIDFKKQLNSDEALKIVLSGHGQYEMEAIRKQIRDMQGTVQSSLKAETEAWHQLAVDSRRTFMTGSALIGLLIMIISTLLYRQIERKKRQGAVHEAETMRLANIVSIQHELSALHLDLDQAMRIITQRTEELTAAKGSIVEILEDNEMVYMAASGLGAPHVGLRLPAGTSLSGLCVAQNKVLKCDDSENDPRVNREACRKVGLRSMVVVPLHRADKTVGVLKVMSPVVAAFDQGDLQTLELMAAVLSSVISDAQAAQLIQLANEDMRKANETLKIQQKELTFANAQLKILATIDGLTGLKNRRVFSENIEAEMRRHKRYKTPVSLILLDVDSFKSFNDLFGHPAGDSTLITVAKLIESVTRETDCVARYGGEEFAVLLPETRLKEALQTAERIRIAIANAHWPHRNITVSLGVNTAADDNADVKEFIEATDKALYKSKQNGRNQVTMAHELLLTLQK